MSLKDDLRRRCRSLLMEFDEEFNDPKLLRAIFGMTEALKPFADNLPDAPNKATRVDLTLNYTLKLRSTQYGLVLLIFLKTLYDRCQSGDERKQSLAKLIAEIQLADEVAIQLDKPLVDQDRYPVFPSIHNAPINPVSLLEPFAARVFLCYAREDKETVRDLYRQLRAAGCYPWMDVEDLTPGELWEATIRKAIKSSDFFVMCLSPHSVNKRGHIQREIKEALDQWKGTIESDIYLIPVRLAECELPDELRQFQWVNLFESDGWQKFLRAIQEGMARRAR